MNRVTTLLYAALLGACLPLSAAALADTIRLATGTTVEDSGLLAHLLPRFAADTGHEAVVIAVGTGHALRLGRSGDVDAVLAHAPAAELAFVEEGFGVERQEFMQSDYLIVGPAEDPAGVQDSANAVAAFARIAAAGTQFVSRGDESGTHERELTLWSAAMTKPDPARYRQAGRGMGPVLQMASDLGAYTLSERGTWLVFQRELDLAPLFEDDPQLANPYSIIAVNPDRRPGVAFEAARSLIRWLVSERGQSLIDEFRIDGEQPFHPLAGVQ